MIHFSSQNKRFFTVVYSCSVTEGEVNINRSMGMEKGKGI